jgi:DNA polymerase-3 subunit gamma/tau
MPATPAVDKPILEKPAFEKPPVAAPVAAPAADVAQPAVPARVRDPDPLPAPAAAGPRIDAERWLELVAASPLRGPARELAMHAGFIAHEGELLRLSLSPADEHLKAPALVKMLADALAPALGGMPQIRFEAAAAAGETLHERSSRDRDARQLAAEAAFVNDPGVQRLVTRHGARVVPDSIRPFDEA